MAKLDDENRKIFRNVVRQYGLLGVLEELADICDHFAEISDSTVKYREASADLRAIYAELQSSPRVRVEEKTHGEVEE